jgi:DNA-binding beta-propeller fold protein YncE
MALGVGVCLGFSLPVPDTIMLPDSLGPLRPPYHLAFGSSTDNIYVASESSDIIVVDGSFTGSFQRIKRINTGTPVGGALLVSQHNKLYCSYPQQGRIGVIDCSTNTIVGSIQVGTRPTLLCYSSGSDKLYCGDPTGRTVSVIDCATNGVLKVIPVGDSLAAMEYDPTTDKLYAATRDAVRAISCSVDSVVANIDTVKSSRGLYVNRRRQKLYVLGRLHTGPGSICVVSTQSDSVVAAMPCGGDLNPRLACNEASDRLYAIAHEEALVEYDCLGDTFTRGKDMFFDPGRAIVCETVHNRLFWLKTVGSLLEIDCATLDIVSETGVERYSDALELDPARYRVMCICGYETAVLAVFDCKSESTHARGAAPLCGWQEVLCHDPVTGKLYYRWGGGVGGVGVIDEQTNRVITQVFLPEAYGSHEMALSRTSNKFYFWTRHGLGVMDGSRDSSLGGIGVGGGWNPCPCWCPDGNKLYCFGTDGHALIAVLDCNTDSVVRKIYVDDLVKWFDYLGDGRMLSFLLETLALIDTRTDSVLLYAPIGGVLASAHTGDGEKIYTARKFPNAGRLEVWSAGSCSLLTTIYWPYFDPSYKNTFLAYSDTTRKLYWFVGDDSVLAIDVTSDTVTARMATSVQYQDACLDHAGRYLFCPSRYDSSLRIYDTQADSLVAIYQHLPYPVAIASSPEQHCIYVGCSDVILVYPDVPPGVEETSSAEVRATKSGPTVVSRMLFVQRERGPWTGDRSALLNVSGRKVMDLKPGANDLRGLPSGVYFLRGPRTEDGRPCAAVHRVVIAR